MKFSIRGLVLNFFIIASVIPSFTQLNLPPFSQSNLRILLEKNAYVDKTKFIHLINTEVEKNGEKFFFLSRPRRFGKSLLIETLNEVYHYNTSPNSFVAASSNISNLWSRGVSVVVKLDFSEISSVSEDEFRASLIRMLKRKAMEASNGREDLKHTTLEDVTEEFFILLERIHSYYYFRTSKVVLLIDEYDAPYTKHDANTMEAQRILFALKNFFSILKRRSSQFHFSFITGVTRIAFVHPSIGLHSFYDITFNPEYAAIVGFTENELRTNFKDQIQKVAETRNKTTEAILKEMELWFGGFQFTSRNERVYNPCSVIAYLRSSGLEKHSWIKSGSSSYAVKKLKDFPGESVNMIQLYRTGFTNSKIVYPPIITQPKYKIEKFVDHEKQTFDMLVANLFHDGYLTIDRCMEEEKCSSYSLRFPNLEIQTDFLDRISEIIFETPQSLLNQIATSVRKSIDSDNWEAFFTSLESYYTYIPSNLFNNIVNNDLQRKEKFYLLLYQYLMVLAGVDWIGMKEKPIVERYEIIMGYKSKTFQTRITFKNNKNIYDLISIDEYVLKFLNFKKRYVSIGLMFSEETKIMRGCCVREFSKDHDTNAVNYCKVDGRKMVHGSNMAHRIISVLNWRNWW